MCFSADGQDTLAYHLNAYPNTLAVTTGGSMVTFDSVGETEAKSLYVTRPLKFDLPDTLKTVTTIIQRGLFRRGDVATALYASRDLYSWQLVWSSSDHYLRGFSGTPYKYFRIAGISTLTEDKSIFSASVVFTAKQTNRLR